MFLSIITIHPFSGDASKIIDVLNSMRGLVAIDADCKGCFLSVEAEERTSICYMERWRTRAALDKHLRSALYCRVLEAMELSRMPPTVEFYEIADIGGLDLIERVRLDPLNADTNERR